MKKNLFALFAVCLLAVEAAELRLSKAGQTDYIIAGDKSSMAVRELQFHLEKITGATFPVCDEKELPAGKPVIYVGDTAFARKLGIDFTKMKPDQWMYQTVGKDLIIGGHAHHGSLYAVAELLEHEFGCRWYSFNAEKIPVNPNLTLKECKRCGVPVFLGRQIVDSVGGGGRYRSYDARKRFYRFDKLNKGNLDDTVYNARSAYFLNCHNIYYLVPPSEYFKTHPEYFTMNLDGKRVHGNEKTRSGGSLCMSNPEVARVAAEHMIRFIAMDRKRLPKGDWPLHYDISELDATDYICYCPECKKITDKAGNFGLMLLFVNRIVRDVAKKYPDIKVRISIDNTIKCEKNWVAEKNVFFSFNPSFTRNDCFRPVTHPINKSTRDRLDSWLKTGKCLAIWDYWNMAMKKGKYFAVPRIDTMVDSIAPNYKYYADHGLISAFIEAEYCFYWQPPCFHTLESWVGRKILENPNRDPEKLIADFMQGYFGPAADSMTEYLNFVRKAVASEKNKMVALNYVCRSYQTGPFLRKCYDMLHKALKSVPAKSEYASRIRAEMITPVATMLYYKNLKTGISREQLFKEYAAYCKEQIELWADKKEKTALKKEVDDDILAMKKFVEVPTPDFLKKYPETQLVKLGYDVLTYRDSNKYVKPDPDSVIGHSLGSPAPNDRSKHGLKAKPHSGMFSSSVKIYNWSTRKGGPNLLVREFPKDEKFHWYKVGNYEFLPGRETLLLWWWEMQGNLTKIYTPPDGNNDINKYTVYVSMKFTGPSYVPESKKPDGVFIDQIILVHGFDK